MCGLSGMGDLVDMPALDEDAAGIVRDRHADPRYPSYVNGHRQVENHALRSHTREPGKQQVREVW